MKNLKHNDRQKFIIDFAKKKKNFQTKDIFVIIKEEFGVERLTVVRDLSLLVKNNLLKKQGQGRSVVYKISSRYLMFEKVDVEKYFSSSFNNRDAMSSFNNNTFLLLDDNLFTSKEISRLRSINNKYIHTKNKLQKESPTILQREWERLIIELSWKSSEIEGNTYTLLETEALIKELHYAKGKDKVEAQMILNHKRVLDFILGNDDYLKTININKIKKIHRLLTEGTGIKNDFRNHSVGITGTIYRPLPKKIEINKAMQKLIETLKKVENPFAKAFVVLIMIAYIQPFEDGNKRTSRIIANAILHANDKSMLSYRNVDAIEYKKAMLLFYEQNNLSYIKKIFIEQFDFAVKNYFNQ